MRPIVSAELVNGVLGDPALYLDFRDERRAVMFDLGDLGRLMPKKILRLTDVFVSHAHMDHFAGFDRLLRVCLGRHDGLRLYGPPGFVEQVEHKLAAYTWNLVERYPGNFTLWVRELAADWSVRTARFRASARFVREALVEESAPSGVLREEPRFRVRAASLDHGIPCLGFALEEKVHVNVWKTRLAEMGLVPGPWLNDLKRAVAEDLSDDTPIHGRTLGELKSRLLEFAPGQKIAYVTDIRYSEENEARVAALAADADLLYIESVFLSTEAEHAARKHHLTAAQAGRIARAARAKHVVPFHFSPRYEGREAELLAELQSSLAP
jgi:ribonuclease Z